MRTQHDVKIAKLIDGEVIAAYEDERSVLRDEAKKQIAKVQAKDRNML